MNDERIYLDWEKRGNSCSRFLRIRISRWRYCNSEGKRDWSRRVSRICPTGADVRHARAYLFAALCDSCLESASIGNLLL